MVLEKQIDKILSILDLDWQNSVNPYIKLTEFCQFKKKKKYLSYKSKMQGTLKVFFSTNPNLFCFFLDAKKCPHTKARNEQKTQINWQ